MGWNNSHEVGSEHVITPVIHLDVSENSGAPKSSILIGFSIINHPFWGTPIFGNTHLFLAIYKGSHVTPFMVENGPTLQLKDAVGWGSNMERNWALRRSFGLSGALRYIKKILDCCCCCCCCSARTPVWWFLIVGKTAKENWRCEMHDENMNIQFGREHKQKHEFARVHPVFLLGCT